MTEMTATEKMKRKKRRKKMKKNGILSLLISMSTLTARHARGDLAPSVTQPSAVMTAVSACGLGLSMTLQAGDHKTLLADASPSKEHQKATTTVVCVEIRMQELAMMTAQAAAEPAGPLTTPSSGGLTSTCAGVSQKRSLTPMATKSAETSTVARG